MRTITAYKLCHLRKDGTLGPLFINRRQVFPVGRWMKAGTYPTKGYALRPGWHVTLKPIAPHLRTWGDDRVWVRVKVRPQGLQKLQRPVAQGGTWLLAQWMKVEECLAVS